MSDAGMANGMADGYRRGFRSGHRAKLPIRLGGRGGLVPHSIEREGLVRDGLKGWERQRPAGWVCGRRRGKGFKPQAEGRVAGRTYLAARAITMETVRKFVAPSRGIPGPGTQVGR
jgi:hypothetical protein